SVQPHTNDLKFSLSVHQQRHFVSANTGDDVTLRCFYESNDVARLYWYKLHLGKESKLISTVNTVDNQAMFHDEFKSDPRFTVNFEKGKIDLQISDLQILDSATYYCASSYGYRFAFAEGTVIDVKGSGSNIPTLVQQSASETIQPGGSVTLNCTVHTGTCDEEHSVYWFRDSEESFPRIIYTHGGRNDQCDRKPNTQTHTCVYNLPMKSLNMSHAGTYYCAVAPCGHILFGNGTKLDLEGESHSKIYSIPFSAHSYNTVGFLYLVHVLNGIVAFTCVLSLCLMSILFVMTKKKSIHFTGKCCCKVYSCIECHVLKRFSSVFQSLMEAFQR
uniref:Ig-like domain-containing protein n=1 Tax=Astatotilapia calliptera TaxID=8154 RepID=A0A3P8Q9E9_ASTCA